MYANNNIPTEAEEELAEWCADQSPERLSAIARRARRAYAEINPLCDDDFDYWGDSEYVSMFVTKLNETWIEDIMRDLADEGLISLGVNVEGELTANATEGELHAAPPASPTALT